MVMKFMINKNNKRGKYYAKSKKGKNMNVKEKAEECKRIYTEKLTSSERKDFNFIANNYQDAIRGKTEIYYDILLHLNTIDFDGRNIPSERDTKCYSCKKELNKTKNFICKTCGWFICSCGACGCSKVKKISKLDFDKYYTKDIKRMKSAILKQEIDMHELPISQKEFADIFRGRAILKYRKKDTMLEEFNRMLKRHRNTELGFSNDSEIRIQDLLRNL